MKREIKTRLRQRDKVKAEGETITETRGSEKKTREPHRNPSPFPSPHHLQLFLYNRLLLTVNMKTHELTKDPFKIVSFDTLKDSLYPHSIHTLSIHTLLNLC
jgi:hypothetical protein